MGKKAILISVLAIILFFIPFNTTLVPEWKLQVVNENDIPYKGKLVRQFCKSYTLGISPCDNSGNAMQLTDENGYVVFPKREIRLAIISRLVRSVFNFIMLFAHGSYGVTVDVDSSGPQGYKRLEYISGQSLPEKLVLPTEPLK